jgi:hypothetical protein
MRFLIKLFLCAIAILFLLNDVSLAMDANLSWDENEPTPESYSVYQAEEGQLFNYNTAAWTGSETDCTITGLDSCKVYIFVVRANACELQSDSSNEIKTIIVKPPAPTNLMQ